MKPIRAANPRRLVILAALLVLISLGFLFWARALIRELFVIPISYLFWSIKTLLIILPEDIQWLAVVTLVMLIAFRALAGRSKKLAAAPPAMAELAYARAQHGRGRLFYWSQKVSLLSPGSSAYYQGTFHYTFGRLLIDLLAHRYRLSTRQVEERLSQDPDSEASLPFGHSLPPEVRAYAMLALNRGQPNAAGKPKPWLQSAWTAAKTWFVQVIHPQNNIVSSGPERTGLEPRILRVLHYMQDELEVPNDDSGG